MDFFAHQDRARRRTRHLLLAFAIAVVGLVAATNLVASVVLDASPRHGDASWRASMHALVSVATLAVIAAGSAWKTAELAAGGGAGVAERLGGRLVAPGSAEVDERRLLDVVEEMALASGVPVPPVYVLDGEDGINAFAAGFAPRDAVVAVTRGALANLGRDELQGVVAHEFSHLLNGDMRLNLRLIGVLHGIVLIGLVGGLAVRAALESRTSRNDGRGRDRNGQLPLLAVGAALIVLGALGTLLGQLIRAAVSRSRELLADASAVQFTRQPGGLAGALKRIGAAASASLVRAPRAAEASHLFFADALAHAWTPLLATHPPLADRIRAIEPGWDGVYPSSTSVGRSPADRAGDGVADRFDERASALGGGERVVARAASDGATSAPVASAPPDAIAAGSAALIAALPAAIASATRDPYSARAIVLALALDPAPAPRAEQLALLAARDAAVAALTADLVPAIAALGGAARLPLIDLSVPALRRLSPSQRDAFVDDVRALIGADGRTTLDEWLLGRLALDRIAARLDRVAPGPRPPSAQAVAVVLAALARAGTGDPTTAARAFAAGCARFAEPRIATALPDAAPPSALDAALAGLALAHPLLQRRLVEACAACIDADAARTPREVELQRVVCASLGVPAPMG